MAATAGPVLSLLRHAARLACALTLALAFVPLSAPGPAEAQFLTFQNQPPRRVAGPTARRPPGSENKMLVQADQIDYDYKNERVSAVGNVQIYFNGSSLEADRVIYDQRNKRLRAEGNARFTEPDGRTSHGDIIDLSDDYRDGFIDSLRVETPDRTRFAAARAERRDGNYGVFVNGVYTACEACKDDPKRPPMWQVKAARIIHDEADKMIYFEDAKVEFLGIPMAYLPYFSTPDPTVKRKTGVLMPLLSNNTNYGFGVEIPYYIALAPDYDLTLMPRVMTKQGLLLKGEWRQRLENGSYAISAAGIYQLDPGQYVRPDGTPTPGNREWRGAVESSGSFNLSPKWTWGWDAILVSDPTFYQNYNLRSLQQRTPDPLSSSLREGVSQIFLTGRGERSYFDIRAVHYTGFSEADVQKQLPIVHPVLDYSKTLASPVWGGELGYSVNLISLTRNQAEFDPITQTAININACSPTTADPSVKTRANCLMRGVPGDYTRASAEAHWRRQFVDPIGQVWTPFLSVRADAAVMSITPQPGVSNFLPTGETAVTRAMPTVGLEYRYPLIAVSSWGTQTVEPIAQLIVRPNETNIGKLPNEDAQSLVFDDSNLFRVDKFSGWDRVEGGGRLNAGVQYTAQFNRSGFVNVLFGQSYQLFGANSFAGMGDVSNTGLNSGLDTNRSDYVARMSYQPNQIYSFTSRFRFDQGDFTLRRLELEGRATFDRWAVSVLYGNYDAQPLLGLLERREGILTGGSLKLNANWVVSGAMRYDLTHNSFNQHRIGVGYVDDCFIMSVNYITDYNYSGNVRTNHSVMLQMSLRTLGGTATAR